MNVDEMATNLGAFLAPVLPYLVKVGAGVWEKAAEIWKRLHPKVEASTAAKDAVADAAKAPDSQRYRTVLEVQLEKLLSMDPVLAEDLGRLLGAGVPQATYHAEVHSGGAVAQGAGTTAAGEGGIAVGGDVHGGVHGSGRSRTRK